MRVFASIWFGLLTIAMFAVGFFIENKDRYFISFAMGTFSFFAFVLIQVLYDIKEKLK